MPEKSRWLSMANVTIVENCFGRVRKFEKGGSGVSTEPNLMSVNQKRLDWLSLTKMTIETFGGWLDSQEQMLIHTGFVFDMIDLKPVPHTVWP